jgi:hypothetical protein
MDQQVVSKGTRTMRKSTQFQMCSHQAKICKLQHYKKTQSYGKLVGGHDDIVMSTNYSRLQMTTTSIF